MKNRKTAAVVGAVLGVALAAIALPGAANADPVSNSYVMVGSDTLQDAANALANGTGITSSQVRVTANGSTIGSFDAFGSQAIQTKSSGAYFARPAGSGDGVNALMASIRGTSFSVTNNTTPAQTITGQVDIARSSSGPGSNQLASGKLAYVPFGRDAVSYAYNGGTSAWANLTLEQLKQIYACTLTTIDGVAVKPVLPQSSSGTRKFFIGTFGTGFSLGGCVTEGVQENDARVLTTAGQIVPFSVASWVAQSNGATPINTTATTGVQMGSAVTGATPFTGTAGALVPSDTYYGDGTFGRDTYVVVEWARIDPTSLTYDATLAGLVDRTISKSLTNFSASPASSGGVKKKFGFLAPSSTSIIRAYTW